MIDWTGIKYWENNKPLKEFINTLNRFLHSFSSQTPEDYVTNCTFINLEGI